MVTTIILALAILTAALVIGVFVVALLEFNEIDEISAASRKDLEKSVLGSAPPTAVEAMEF